MQIIHPWKTEIIVVNAAQWLDLTALKVEIATLNTMVRQEDESYQSVTKELYPNIAILRDGVVCAAVSTYTENCWKYAMNGFRVETTAQWINDEEDQCLHTSPGAQLTAIFYTSDSKSDLNLFDPRSNVARGYPKVIRDNFMGVHKLSPKAGDIVIFPSYLQHSVSRVKGDTQLSLLFDYYFNDNR